jgi:hypothetical protein
LTGRSEKPTCSRRRGESWEAFVLVVGPTIRDDEILAFDVAEISEPLPQSSDRALFILPRRRSPEPDSVGRRSLLRLGRERRKREAERENEPDPPHGHVSVEDGWRGV